MRSGIVDGNKMKLWNRFIDAHRVIDEAVPLLSIRDGAIVVFSYGANNRPMLRRSQEMGLLLRTLGKTLVAEFNSSMLIHDGILYMMLTRHDQVVVPRYIGKAEVIGKGDHNLSANISDLITGDGKFGRWGYNYAYHLGDLSAACLPGHPDSKRTRKYARWRDGLFDIKDDRVRPKSELLFWATLWSPERSSIWAEYGSTRLAFEEYLLIGIASDLFPDYLLNSEGRNRQHNQPN